MRYFLLLAVAALCLTPANAGAQVYGGDPQSLVEYWYNKYLGRAGDPTMATWVNSLSQGTPADQVLTGIIASDEYYRRAGATPEGFIARLYSDVLGRTPNVTELDFWVRRMYTEDRPTLIMEFLHQNPGVWVTSAPAVSTSVVVTPSTVGVPWYRESRHDWDRHHHVYDYRRPNIPYLYHHDDHHRDDHHEHHH